MISPQSVTYGFVVGYAVLYAAQSLGVGALIRRRKPRRTRRV